MAKTVDDVLVEIGRSDPSFNQEIRNRLAPVKDRFFAGSSSAHSDYLKDGLHWAPPWMTEPDLRQVAIGLAELVLSRGVDVNLPWDADGTTLLHHFGLVRDPVAAVDAVGWLLEHGADPNQQRDDGETPLSLAVKFGRTAVAELMRAQQ